MLRNEFKTQGDFLFRYRGSLPLIILFFGLFIFVINRINLSGDYGFMQSTTYKLICMGVAFGGQFIRILTVGFTPINTSGRNKYTQIADEVNTTGIYSTVRHPLYLGNFFMWLGVAMLAGSIWLTIVFVLFYWVYYERIMYAEEMFLLGKFGEKYENWANSTPAFVPSFKNYKKPSLPFSWKKIIKKEKNGINAIFTLFFIFDFVANILDAGKFIVVFNAWFIAAAVSFAVYLILKLIKRNTSLLDEEGR